MTTTTDTSARDLERHIELYDIRSEDLESIRKVGALVSPHLDAIVDEFYVWLEILPEYRRFFQTDEDTSQVKSLQKQYWMEFFQGSLDVAYVESRKRVGAVHATIGLSLQAYFAAMNKMMMLILEYATKGGESMDVKEGCAVARMIHLDTAIVVDTFSELTNQTIREQSEAIMAMSTPVTSIWDDILVLPIVGIIDSKRAHDIMTAMLNRIRDTEATVFILDISGVAVMDTAVANHLIKMTKAALLMGCQCILSGISPSIASTVVELGINVEGVQTRANLKDALSLAFAKTGVTLNAATT